MLPLERRREIINKINSESSVKVIELSKEFGVTEETIRRDLEKLEKEGLVVRTYGGAVVAKELNKNHLLDNEEKEQANIRKNIGKVISSLIEDGDIVMLDSSPISLEAGKSIGHDKEVTLITNSVGTTLELLVYEKMKIICLGGTLSDKSLALNGPITKEAIKKYNADKLVLSCSGVDIKKGLMEANETEADIKRAMLSSSKTVILAVESDKFDTFAMASLFDIREVDIIVTDKEPDIKWKEFLNDLNIKYIVAETNCTY